MNDYTPKPYLKFELIDGYLSPQFPVVFDLHPFNCWHEKDVRYNAYLEFLKSLKISGKPSLSEISQVVTYRKHLFDQVNHYIKELEKIDQLIFNVAGKMLNMAKDREKAKPDFYNFCSGIRRCIPFENLSESWVPKRIEKHVSIDDDFLSFIEHSTKRKQKILNVISPLFEKLMHLDSFLYFYETGKPINEGFPDDKVDKIIRLAISNGNVQKKNKKHAQEYLKAYAKVKKENPLFNKEECIKEIGMTGVSNITYRTWMENYEKAKKMLLDD